MTDTMTQNRSEDTVLITDVFQNISQVPVGAYDLSTNSSIDSAAEYRDIGQEPTENSLGDYSDYLYDEFSNYSSLYNYDYRELNNATLQPDLDKLNKFNMTSAHLNHSDLYNLGGYRYDSRANFLDSVVGNLFLVPLAFIVGLCIGLILWGIFILIRKIFIVFVRWLGTTLPQIVDQIRCAKILCIEPKITKTKTIWYENSVGESEKNNTFNSILQSKKVSEPKKDSQDSEANNNNFLGPDTLHELSWSKHNSDNALDDLKGRKVSNSTFFLSNGINIGVDSHQMSGTQGGCLY